MDEPLEEAGAALAERVALLVKNQHRFKLDDRGFESAVAPRLPHSERRKLPPPEAPKLTPPPDRS
jgi:hypothetical protein